MRRCRQCGETFETLSAYRLHQKDECPASSEVALESDDLDAITDQVIRELSKCEECGAETDEYRSLTHDMTSAGIAIEVTFRCECGFLNDNTAVIE